MKCPSCSKSKFPALDTSAEPEVSIDDCTVELLDSEDKNKIASVGSATVTGSVRIVLTSECCGEDMKEANFDIDLEIDVEKAADCTCDGASWYEDAEAEEAGPELTDTTESTKPFTYKRGPLKGQTINKPIPYRFRKRFYGALVPIAVKCGCGKKIGEGTFEDRVQASGMDELC